MDGAILRLVPCFCFFPKQQKKCQFKKCYSCFSVLKKFSLCLSTTAYNSIHCAQFSFFFLSFLICSRFCMSHLSSLDRWRVTFTKLMQTTIYTHSHTICTHRHDMCVNICIIEFVHINCCVVSLNSNGRMAKGNEKGGGGWGGHYVFYVFDTLS